MIRKTKMAMIVRNVFGLMFLVFFTACALGVDRVKLYDPLTHKPDKEEAGVAYADVPIVTPISSEKIKIAINVRDIRFDISSIGVKKNANGVPMGKVDVEEGVIFLDLFKKHLANAFQLAGYEIVSIKSYDVSSAIKEENVKAFVVVDIRIFSVEFMPGFFTVDALSNVVLEVTLKKPEAGRDVWSGMFRGQGKVSSGFAITRDHYEESINLAYAEAMRKLYGTISDEKIRNMFKK